MFDAISAAVYDWVQNSAGYPPHAICLLYDPVILTAEVLFNLGVALAYFAIPIALWLFLRRFETLPFRSVIVMFVVFILACGTSHLTAILTMFVGGWAYWVDVAVLGVTVVASLGTAIGLVAHGPAIFQVTGRLLRQSALPL